MNIFPKPQSVKALNGYFALKGATISALCPEATRAAEILAARAGAKVGKEGAVTFSYKEGEKEAYAIEITPEKIEITASSRRGYVNAAETLSQCIDAEGNVPCASISDAPYKKYRGIHLYMPAMEYMDECKRLFDVLSYLKFNTVIIEVGGGMEYKKHPEINRGWLNFVDMIVNKFPGGPQNFQWSDKYWKDSTHYEQARGQILPQEALRDLVQYAKDLGLVVIPEIQALSHAYYLTLSHPEIAECPEDLFPDTYCPMNEESYKLYFDVAEEVISVFEPEIVSIGHDEIRIMGECPRCKGKTGHEILSYEINKLHDFYAERGIRIMMWCESCAPSADDSLYSIDRVDDYGRPYRMLRMNQALDTLPRDIIMLDWHHSVGHNTEEHYKAPGHEVWFGNFWGITFGNWDIRSKNVEGAEISTWCTPDEFTLGRNGVLFDMIFSSQIFWGDEYSDAVYDVYLKNAMEHAEKVREVMCGKKANNVPVKALYKAESGEYAISCEKAAACGENAKAVLNTFGNLSGVPVDTTHLLFDTDIYADSLVLCEAFKKPEQHFMSYSFINTAHWDESPMSDSSYYCVNMPRWSAATHEILYEDGTRELANATYGITAGDVAMSYERQVRYLGERTAEIDDEVENAEAIAPHRKVADGWMTSLLYFADTIVDDGKTAYVYEWKNPYPEKKIVRIRPISTTHDKEQSVILFALGYKEHK